MFANIYLSIHDIHSDEMFQSIFPILFLYSFWMWLDIFDFFIMYNHLLNFQTVNSSISFLVLWGWFLIKNALTVYFFILNILIISHLLEFNSFLFVTQNKCQVFSKIFGKINLFLGFMILGNKKVHKTTNLLTEITRQSSNSWNFWSIYSERVIKVLEIFK